MPGHRLDAGDLALGEIGQFEVFEEHIDEFVPRQSEAEIILTLSVRAAFGPAATAAGRATPVL